MITPPDRITYISARTTTIRHAIAPNPTHTTVATKQNWIATKSEVMPEGAAARIASEYWIPNSITPDGLSADVTGMPAIDRKSTRLNSSHLGISYAVFCLKKNEYNVRETGEWYIQPKIEIESGLCMIA